MTDNSEILAKAGSFYHFYQAAACRGWAFASSFTVDNVPLNIATIQALLNNLPGPFWEAGNLFLQADPLPQLAEKSWQADSGLEACRLTGPDLLIDIGNRTLGSAVTYWLAQAQNFAAAWYRLSRKYGLAAEIKNANSTATIQQVMAKMAFLLGSDLDELATIQAESDERLLQALLTWSAANWQPVIRFHHRLEAKETVAASDLPAVLNSLDLRATPLHLILTDNPAPLDLLAPYVRELRPVLEEWFKENPSKVWPAAELDQALDQNSFSEDELYWILRDFLRERDDLAAEYIKAAATCGIIMRHGLFGTPGSYALIDLSALELSLTDPRLLLSSQKSRPNGLLLLLPLNDGHDMLRELLSTDLTLTSVALLKRSHSLNQSAIQLPMAWISGLEGHISALQVSNQADAGQLTGLTNGRISAGVMASLPASYWISPAMEEALASERLAIAYDLEGSSLINSIMTALLENHRLAPTWQWRAIYYSGSGALEDFDTRQGLTDHSALAGAYAGACALLRSILLPERTSAPATPTGKKSSGSSFRLRV